MKLVGDRTDPLLIKSDSVVSKTAGGAKSARRSAKAGGEKTGSSVRGITLNALCSIRREREGQYDHI